MFKQSEVLSATEDVDNENGDKDVAAEKFTRKTTYPTLELRGVVGDYPILYNHVDDLMKVQGVAGTSNVDLVDIDVDLVSDGKVIRGFNYNNCRAIDYTVETETNKEESYVKNKFALENIFEFECQGYHPNNPAYDAMFSVEKANTESTFDLRNTDRWGQGFTVRE
jgi:archaellin